MQKVLRFSCFIFIITCLSNTSFGQTNHGSIEGNVTSYSSRNSVLPYVYIVAYSGGIQKAYTKTDIKGHYKIVGLQPGEYTIKATAPGYGPLEITQIKINGSDNINLNLRLPHPHLRNVKLKYNSTLKVSTESPNRQTITHEELRQMSR